MFIFNLHCQLDLRISGYMLHKNKSQSKISIVPEDGWFQWPAETQYTVKNILRPVGFCLYILHFTCQEDSITIDPK